MSANIHPGWAVLGVRWCGWPVAVVAVTVAVTFAQFARPPVAQIVAGLRAVRGASPASRPVSRSTADLGLRAVGSPL